MGGEVSMDKGGRPRVETLVSAGGVVYRCVNGRVEAVLCGLAGPDGSSGPEEGEVSVGGQGEKVRWTLAKGTPDPGETLEETALREVREETGLEVELDAPLGTIEYWFAARDNQVRYHKTVHFYLMAPVGGDTELHDLEFDVVRWFPADIALKALAYANEVQVLQRALELISKRKSG
jgi:8-oxo-dGTP pyrophosphatase MutT (NUDIX family)